MNNSNSLIYKTHHEDTPEVESSINLEHDWKVYPKLISEGHFWKSPGI